MLVMCLFLFHSLITEDTEHFGRKWSAELVDQACRLWIEQEADRTHGVPYDERQRGIYGP